MDVRIEDSWKRRLQPEFNKPYFEKLVAFVNRSMRDIRYILPAICFFMHSIRALLIR